MAITKNIVKMMGGSISVASEKGVGTEFVVSVEFRTADKKTAEHEDAEEQAYPTKGKKVLMVDDSKLNLKIGVLLLQEKGMIVDTASNGQVAVDMIMEKGVDAYDFVLMDVQMPLMDGYEATSLIRKLPGGGKLKIIAFSANAFQEDKEMSMKAGMDGHIAKPLKVNELLNELKRFAV
jgi:CheY-like chemotaxis protein